MQYSLNKFKFKFKIIQCNTGYPLHNERKQGEHTAMVTQREELAKKKKKDRRTKEEKNQKLGRGSLLLREIIS